MRHTMKRLLVILFALALCLTLGLTLLDSGKSRVWPPRGYLFNEAMKDITYPRVIASLRPGGAFYMLQEPVGIPWEHGTLTVMNAWHDGKGLYVEGIVTFSDDWFAQRWPDRIPELPYPEADRLFSRHIGGDGYGGAPDEGCMTFYTVYERFYLPGLPFTLRYADTETKLKLIRVKGTPQEEDLGFTARQGDISFTAIPFDSGGMLAVCPLVIGHLPDSIYGFQWPAGPDNLWVDGPGGRFGQITSGRLLGMGGAYLFDVPFADAAQYTLNYQGPMDIRVTSDAGSLEEQRQMVFEIPLR